MFGCNEVVSRNAEEYAKVPAICPPNYKVDDLLTATEGGFASGSRVVVDNPDDALHDKAGVCGYPHTPRTITVTIGGTVFNFCVSSLWHA